MARLGLQGFEEGEDLKGFIHGVTICTLAIALRVCEQSQTLKTKAALALQQVVRLAV